MLGVKQNEETPQITAQDEALKRNTDCIYFLASPLTCKKGIECEYRHSDIARLNPQDCWFWLNGNCLNPKCAFRHPPLDGLLGTQVTSAVNSLPPSQTMVPVASQGLNVPGKQAVPCIFFQKGYCLKGDMCPFMHAPYSLNNKATQSAGATPVSESQPNKKTFGGLGKHTQVQKFSQGNSPKSAILPPQEKSADAVKKAPLRNEISISRNASSAAVLDDELPQYRPGNVHSFSNGNSVSRSNRNHQVHIVEDQSVSNVKDADEVSRELSPGFDVLVDDELMDSEYYPDEDGIYTGQDGINLDATNEYGIRRSAGYGPVVDADRDMYHDNRKYDSFGRQQGHYGREVQRSSSERVSGGSAYLERRRHPRADSPGRINGSDLRHHLSKQKRNTGLRSIISRDRTREGYADDRSYRAPGRDHLPAHDNLVSSRLRGRIKIPGRSVSPIPPLSEKEIDRGRHRSRLSSERPLGRLRDRIKGRVQEAFINERNIRGSRITRDIVDDSNADFSGPKSLSELKADGKDYNLDEGENADPEDDYFDEDDDADDFAKKMGVLFS
ncbi:zinc finger CCCH domain-containing protein 17 [Heracleum sosnowskyi]|uniref:Zinc finger CCCH domain-containing protein 17 n=1 Tax=Heracleum sosnowskyi TaxID=360622 RepID=A0AAD8IK32_9APIA|nr:zinc finger CCCH domain-containing protein 17 [Heracleum sosnowskyi]